MTGRWADHEASPDTAAPDAALPDAALLDAATADAAIADAATTGGLLRCWFRETGVRVPDTGEVRIPLPASGTALVAEVLHRSPTGHHRFGSVRLPGGASPNAVTVAALLSLEGSAGNAAEVTELLARVADSQQRTTRHLRERRDSPEGASTPFLAAEQALVLGHPMHPTPNSRNGWSEQEAAAYSPELRGSFALHWFAADRSVVSSDGGPQARLEGFTPEVPEGTVPVPVHPWQARSLLGTKGVRALLDAGLLHDLGVQGPRWFPTSSIRTVCHPDAPVMLKFSLGLPITNSKRENLRKELHRGVEIDRLLDAGLAGELAAAHPDFSIVRDPAWLTVDVPSDSPDGAESGWEVLLRDNPFGAQQRAACVAGLLAERPELGGSALQQVIDGLVERTGESRQQVAEQWCARYFDHLVAPVLWLYREHGVGLEAHQQNSLIGLDGDGWPNGGWYRDNQGYYLSETRVAELERFLPGVGIAGENRVDDAVIDERLGYYIGINNLIGLVGAFGSQGLADERRLLALLRARLREFSDLPLAAGLAESSSLRCKANLLTRLGGMDELVGPLETQSVYVDIANPFAEGESAA